MDVTKNTQEKHLRGETVHFLWLVSKISLQSLDPMKLGRTSWEWKQEGREFSHLGRQEAGKKSTQEGSKPPRIFFKDQLPPVR